MLRKWKAAWLAGWAILMGKDNEIIALGRQQTDALIQLQSQYMLRRSELYDQFPEVAFTLQRLGESGDDWEWFPPSDVTAMNSPELLTSDLRQDVKRHPYNYQIVSHEQGASLEEGQLQLISSGIRKKIGKKALVKAKISLHSKRTPGELQSLVDELQNM